MSQAFDTGFPPTESFLSRSLAYQSRTGKRRLHYLDWFRFLMVLAVVFAHTTLMGFDEIDGTASTSNDRSWNVDDPASLTVRWISIIRPFCLPLLFWVSGASCACSFHGRIKGLDKLLLFTLVGVASNAALWYLGPLDKRCAPDRQDRVECQGKGILFDFTVCPWAGRDFAILFQMWYTLALIVMSLLNYPLFKVIHGSWSLWTLGVQWLVSVLMYAVLIHHAANCEDPPFVLGVLATCEAIFLYLAPYAASAGPTWGKVPTRVVQYAVALTIMLQFGATPFASGVDTISAAFVCFIFVGFNKFFALGFVMIHSDAEPVVQRCWPAVVLGLCFIMPSTNFVLAGNLTYPFFPFALDRCMYVAFAIVVIFSIQRHGHDMPCIALPHSLNDASLLLYLFHPALMTLFVYAGFMHSATIWLYSCTAVFVFIACVKGLCGLCRKKNQ